MNGECYIMKKSVTIAILTGVFTAFTVMCTLNNTEQLISDGVLRLHVIAHDNTDEEQELKLKVRDRILKEGRSIYGYETKKENIRSLTMANIDRFEKAATDEVIKNGFDWPKEDYLSVLGKVKEEIEEIEDAINGGEFEHIEAEIGDLLFATIHLAKHLDVDAETALFKCNKRFSERFRLVEILAKISDDRKKLKDFTHEQLLEFWRNAKILLSESSFDNALENLKKKYEQGNND